MDTNLYFQLRGTYLERKAKLNEMSKEYLEAAILDTNYNAFLSARADYTKAEQQLDSYDSDRLGKRLPYIGWYWRHITFNDLTRIPIGDCGNFIGFMANNKWDHPERYLTIDEAQHVIKIIDEAQEANQQGGELGKIVANTNAKLDELWDYIQTLKI